MRKSKLYLAKNISTLLLMFSFIALTSCASGPSKPSKLLVPPTFIVKDFKDDAFLIFVQLKTGQVDSSNSYAQYVSAKHALKNNFTHIGIGYGAGSYKRKARNVQLYVKNSEGYMVQTDTIGSADYSLAYMLMLNESDSKVLCTKIYNDSDLDLEEESRVLTKDNSGDCQRVRKYSIKYSLKKAQDIIDQFEAAFGKRENSIHYIIVRGASE